MLVNAKLEVETFPGRVIVHLTILNHSTVELLVRRRNVFATPTLRSNFFSITADDKRIRYVGTLAKVKDTGVDDYFHVPAGGSLSGAADIYSLYAFLPGRHSYKISYSAFFDNPDDKSRLLEVTSNEVSFSLEKD